MQPLRSFGCDTESSRVRALSTQFDRARFIPHTTCTAALLRPHSQTEQGDHTT